MDFLKKHYEKVLLGVVLLGLLGAVISLPIIKNAQDAQLQQILQDYRTPKILPLAPLDLSTQEITLKRAASPVLIDFGPPNKLFNPVLWQRSLDGHLIKADSTNVGPRAVIVTKITPLYLILSYDSVTVSESGDHYVIGMKKEASPKPAERNISRAYLPVGQKDSTRTFELKAIEGPPDSPTNVVLRLADTGEDVKLSKDKPFKRIDGYMADLKYDPEKQTWPDKRVGAVLSLNGEEYNIVAISQDEVVLSAPNKKKWTIKYSPSPVKDSR
ncbi:MAG: hypothetical protein LV481_07675 [Methylacidiphilales bacterium]|nr:hypothetical protein [Candidatus Methylacidiphilales bacterium]